jgi:hypothetical protein
MGPQKENREGFPVNRTRGSDSEFKLANPQVSAALLYDTDVETGLF